MDQVFKFVLELMYDSVLSFGLLFTVNQAVSLVRYHLQTQHEEKMARLNNEFLSENRLLR